MKLYCAVSSAHKNVKDLNYGHKHGAHLQDSHKQIIFVCTWLLTPLHWICLKRHNKIEVAVKWCEVVALLKMVDVNCKTAEVNEIKSSWARVTTGTSKSIEGTFQRCGSRRRVWLSNVNDVGKLLSWWETCINVQIIYTNIYGLLCIVSNSACWIELHSPAYKEAA